MASRLEKLFELLESNNASIRSAAVNQISQVSLNSNVELSNLLNKLLPYLKHKIWHVRISASEAIYKIGKTVKSWIPNRSLHLKANINNEQLSDDLISLETLDLMKVLNVGSKLYSTSDLDIYSNISSSVEVNKSELNRQLGLPLHDDNINDELLKEMYEEEKHIPKLIRCNSETIPIHEAVYKSSQCNNRDKKSIKRRSSEVSSESIVKRMKRSDDDCSDNNSDENQCKWEWLEFCEELINGLWDPKWEIRHGCATGLRELLRTQGSVIINRSWLNCTENGVDFNSAHLKYLEDIAARLLCTLVLDQVSDFVSDEVIAPVRESCAQTLGLLCTYLQNDTIIEIVCKQHLLQLVNITNSNRYDWTIQHSALLALKYIVLSYKTSKTRSKELQEQLIEQIYEPVSELLMNCNNEEVQCAAANVLSAIFSGQTIVSFINMDTLRLNLWKILPMKLDCVSSGASGAILQLLEKLYKIESNEKREKIDEDLLMDYLNCLHWCYYDYSITIRLSALSTCQTLLIYSQDFLESYSFGLIQKVLCQIYQRLLLDDEKEVIEKSLDIWYWLIKLLPLNILLTSCLEHIDLWICAAMQPEYEMYQSHLLSFPSIPSGYNNEHQINKANTEQYIAGRTSFMNDGNSEIRKENVLLARIKCSEALGKLIDILARDSIASKHIFKRILLETHLNERGAIQRFVASIIISNTPYITNITELSNELYNKLLSCLNDAIYYQEILGCFKQMMSACTKLLVSFQIHGINIDTFDASNCTTTLSMQQCQLIVSDQYQEQIENAKLNSEWSYAKTSTQTCVDYHRELSRIVDVSLSKALLIWPSTLQAKLTPIIKPLMDAVKCDVRSSLQLIAARALAFILYEKGCQKSQITQGILKLFNNVLLAYSTSIDQLYPITSNSTNESSANICVLYKADQSALTINGDTPFLQELTSTNNNGNNNNYTDNSDYIKYCGMKLVLKELSKSLINQSDHELIKQVFLHDLISQLELSSSSNTNITILLSNLRGLEICLENGLKLVDDDKLNETIKTFGLCHSDCRIRHWCARILTQLIITNHNSIQLLDRILLAEILPNLYEQKGTIIYKRGLIEFIYLMTHLGPLNTRLVLLPLLLPALLRTLNCADESTRRVAALTFSHLLTLMPLENCITNQQIQAVLSQPRINERTEARAFIQGLLHARTPFIDVKQWFNVTLRNYQQQGVNWLGFLNQYGLHGILADDMGLGKTLQTLCIIVATSYKETKNKRSTNPSLIVCPTTLTKHWSTESSKFIQIPQFKTLIFSGTSEVRAQLASQFLNYDLIITSYDIIRNDSSVFNSETCNITWHYLVLDEGHLIRNHRSKISSVIKQIRANNRLVLTGTPIQNRIGELWSIFDFLMPGLLGSSHGIFQKKFGISKLSSGSDNQKNLDQLHKQVNPFMMRRIKQDVLNELPAKIMQDYICTMSGLQQRLYSFIMDQESNGNLDKLFTNSNKKHTFQTLHYLRQVCNHPSLVLKTDHPLYSEVLKQFLNNNPRVLNEDIELSGKLVALKQLILDCGVGVEDSSNSTNGTGSTNSSCYDDTDTIVSNHRLLIFCQSRTMIGLVANMIKKHIPIASFLKMDGTVNIKERQNIVDKFCEDPSVDMLLLTTGVGGLGLNLSCADTVIFVEHDWNPMKDSQAMDRAHRIGQKNTVMVYRLITSDSIEEKIMNLQQFKLYLANSVITGVGSTSTNCGDIVVGSTKEERDGVELEDIVVKATDGGAGAKKSVEGGGKLKSILQELEAAGDWTKEYDEEFDMDAFIKKI